MIQINKRPTDRILELGGGANPHPMSDVRVDVRFCNTPDGKPCVDFTADFNEPLPIKDHDFDGVYSHFALEHVSWRKVPQLVGESFRVLKPGGRAVFVVPNTEAQLKWVQEHPQGWDGKNLFESASCILYGDLDYPENSHRAYFSPPIARELFLRAGFKEVEVHPYGPRETDMVIVATKFAENQKIPPTVKLTDDVPRELRYETQWVGENAPPPEPKLLPPAVSNKSDDTVEILPAGESEDRASLFDRHYWDGGGKVGGYAYDRWGTAYRDFPCHELTARHVLHRKPESVCEIGAARGYIGRRLEDAGVFYHGLEISKHCYLTRACDSIVVWDFCRTEWPMPPNREMDLCFSIAVLEHVPEQYLPAVIAEMKRTCKRGLHGVDFGQKDDGFDTTHATLKPREWWLEQFAKYAPGWPVEVVDKETLEQLHHEIVPEYPKEVLEGDGKVKLNVGSFTVMAMHGWTNIDIADCKAFADHNRYNFLRCDVRHGLPFGTGTVDLISSSHFLEHLPGDQSLKFLRECRRVIKPTGAMRIGVPDAGLLMRMYMKETSLPFPSSLSDFAEINEVVANARTDAQRLWALLHENHSQILDEETLVTVLKDAGFKPLRASFRAAAFAQTAQIVREAEVLFPDLTLIADAVPLT